jgi:hypothetical protein
VQIAHATVRKLCDIKGISEQKAQKLKDIAYKLVPMGFVTVRLFKPSDAPFSFQKPCSKKIKVF